MHTTVKTDIRQRPTITDRARPIQKPPIYIIPTQMQQPSGSNPSIPVERHIGSEPSVAVQRPCNSDSSVVIQRYSRPNPTALLLPRADLITPMQRPPRADPPAPVQRPPRADPPAPVQRPHRADPPAPVQRPPRAEPPAPVQRPHRADPPAPVQRPPRADPPAPVQRPSRADPPAPVQRPSRSDPPAQRPPRADPPAPVQRPPRAVPPAPVQRPPRADPPSPVQRPPRADPPAPVQRPPRADPPAPVQRPPRADPPAPVQRPPRIDPPAQMQRPTRADNPTTIQRLPRTEPPVMRQSPPRTEPPVMRQSPPTTEPPSEIQKPPRTEPPAALHPRTDSPTTIQRPLRTEPQATLQRPPRTGPPASMQRPPRTDPPGSMQRPPRTDPPGSMQRPPRTDPPGSVQRPPRTDPPGSVQRPPRTDPPGSVQRPPRTDPPGLMQRPLRTDHPDLMQRPPRTDPPGSMQRPPRTDAPGSMQRPPRTDPPGSMQRPPRTDPPVSMQRPPRTDPPVSMQRPPRTDPPVSMQRPPRTDPPASMQSPPRTDPPASMQRPPRTDPPASMQRPPRIDPPDSMQRATRTDPPDSMQRPPRIDPPDSMQRPPRTDPPDSMQRSPRTDPPDSMQRSPRTDPPDSMQRPPRTDPQDSMQRPPRTDLPDSMQRPPRTDPPDSMQRPPRTDPPDSMQRPPRTDPPDSMQRPPRTDPPDSMQRPPRTDPPDSMQRPPRTDPPDSMQRPPRTDPPGSMQRPPRTDPPGLMQRPPRTDPPGSMQRPPRTDPPGSMQRPPRTDPPGSMQRPPRTDPPDSMQRPPRTDPPGSMQRPLRRDPPDSMQRPPRKDPPDSMQRPPRTDPPDSMQRPPRTDPPAPMQRPPRSDPPALMQRPPRTDAPSLMQRPPRTDPPALMQRPPRTDPPALMQRPPRTDPPALMQRPPRTDPPALMQRPPRTDPPALMQRPPRTDPPALMQRPPRTDPPALMQRPPRTDPSALMQRPPRTDPPGLIQRPPRSDPPAPIQRPPRTDPPDQMQRLPRADPPAPKQKSAGIDSLAFMQKPPRVDPITVKNDSSELVQRTLQSSLSRPVQDPSHTGCPAVVQMPTITKPQLGVKTSSPMQRDLRNQPHSGMQGLVRTESVLSPMEKPIKTGPSSLMQNPSCSGSTIIMQKNTSSDTRNRDDAHTAYMSLDSPQSSVQDEVEHTDDLSSGGLVGYVNESQKDQKRGNSYQQPGPNGENQSPDVGLLVRNTLGAGRFLSLGPSSPDAKVYDVAEEDEGLYITLEVDDLEDEEKKKRKRYMSAKRKRDAELQATLPCDIDPTLDQKLEDGAKHHNLTVVNVRNILHEVITNEHVVAMMKAAITETEEMPMFEPKMTRSKLKEVVGKGVVIPTWNLSPIKKASEIKPPQFVDIPLEEEDSSDEEYQPEEEEEDETAEESLLESDVESTSSSPRGPKRPRVHHPSESMETEEEGIKSQQMDKQSDFVKIPRVAPFRHISAEVVPMGPPPPPPKPKNIKDSTFMEKLHAVDEELASTAVCLDSLQSLDDKLIACRTRSKRPLKDVPLGQLEAELQAPDITPDMYDANTADDEDWQMWLRSLMQDDVGNEDDADDDDDDPEYNILEDFEEPDTEDLRNDRAVRITKKEVNELMEELFETFETFQDEIDFSHVEDEEPDEEDSKDSNPETVSNFNTPQAIRFEEPLANIMNEQHSSVKAKLDFLRMKKSVMKPTTPFIEEPKPLPPAKGAAVLSLNMEQKRRLQQQMQQHVQLLTQMHLLTCRNPKLSVEADTARMFLVELSNFANSSSSNHSSHSPNFQTMFQPCNLKEALQLIPIFHNQVPEECEPSKPAKRNVYELSYLPRHLAWIMITHTVFIYPELLPVCSLKPRGPRDRVFFTKPEDNLLTLGLKHFEGTEFIKTMISKYLLTTKTAHQLTVRIKNLTMKKTPDNIIKFYKKTKLIPMMGKCCEDVQVHDVKPPIEREKHRMPFWLKASLSNIEAEMGKIDALVPDTRARPKHYPLIIPPTLVLNLKPLPKRFYLKTLRQKRSSILKPLLIRPSSCTNTSSLVKTAVKPSDPQPVPVRLYKRVSPIIHSAVPIQGIMGVHSVNIPAGRKPQEPYAPFISNESCQLMSFPQPVHITQAPVSQVKTMLPALVPQKIKKPPICGVPRKKNVLRNPGFKPTHPMHTAPVLFTVPNGNVKLVSLGSTCGMIQPVSNGGAIPVTTLLLNPTTFPLNQTLLSPPLSQTVVSAPLPIPKEQLVIQDQSNFAPEVSLESVAANEEVRTNLNEESGALDDNTHITITIEVEEKSQVSAGEDDGQERQDGNTVEENGGLIKDGENIQDKERQTWHVLEGCCFTSEDEKEIVEGGGEISPLKDFNCPLYQSEFPLSPLDKKTERELEFDLGSSQSEQLKMKGENVNQEMGEAAIFQNQPFSEEYSGSEEPVDMEEPQSDSKCNQNSAEEEHTETTSTQDQNATELGESPKNTTSSTDGDVDMCSPVETPHDSSSPVGHQDSGNDKNGQDEEEEEDFDDLTQDDEEEEMSSASEESVLSVPELQETMEKLTWLASERRLSQEADSEENSEPEEEEEEEEGEGVGSSSQKEEEMTDEVTEGSTAQQPCHLHIPSPAPVKATTTTTGLRRRGGSKVQSSHRVRSRRGRARASKDSSKLLLLYDENILLKDPQREQKDMAFAQAYLNRVREALSSVQGKYEDFLQLIYQFELCRQQRTAVDLYKSIRELLQDSPQLLKDFAAFLLPEEALECGLFEEQQAFDKSRKFLRQLEISFLENPSHYQKIIKLLQNCAECPEQEISKLKAQMWQLLKGHNHLQDEFSLFFDQLRPPASRLGDFEVMNWTEEKVYKFDGFEEITLPDVEEEEEQTKMQPPQRSKRRKEVPQESDCVDGGKYCPCSCHEGGGEHRLKRCKRRMCNHCSSKTCESRSHKSRDTVEGSVSQSALRQGSVSKETSLCEGRIPLNKSTGSDERLSAGAQALMGNRPTSIEDSNVSTQRSGSAVNPRGVAFPENSDNKLHPPSKDSPNPAPRSGRRLLTFKGSNPPLENLHIVIENPDGTSSCQPSTHKPAYEEDFANQTPCVSSSNTSKSINCTASPTNLDQSHSSQQILSNTLTDRYSDREEQMLTVCAKNITVSSSGEKVILWTREADRVILTMCQEQGALEETFTAISERLGNKSPEEVSQRFRELVRLFQTSCETSSDEDDEAGSTTEQLSDQEAPLSDDET